MGKVNLRPMGSVDNSGGLELQYKQLPPLSESPIPFSVSSDPHKRLRLSEEVFVLFAEGSNRTGSNFFPESRILFPSPLGPQEKGGNETSNRPFSFEYLPCGPPFQNGDQQVHQGFYAPRNVVDIARFNRCLFPLPYVCGFQEIPSLRVGQHSFSASSSPIRVSHHFSNCLSSSAHTIYPYSFLPGRFSCQGTQPRHSFVSYPDSYRPPPRNRFPVFLEEIGDHSVSVFRFQYGLVCFLQRRNVWLFVSLF
jgi:hypothetical protein